MTDGRSESSIGARIKATRRRRGFRTTRELADAIPGGNITAAILENIESGRKPDVSVSQLLNIARGLDVPPSMLLAPMYRPGAVVDLPNLSDHLAGMSAAEFDCWLSATPASAYQPRHAAERIDIGNLRSLRELGMFQRELTRLRIVREVETTSGDADLVDANAELKQRVESLSREVERLSSLLSSAGFTVEREENS